jgi:hypothetical protein
MEIISLNRSRGALKAKVTKLEVFGSAIGEQSFSKVELNLQLRTCSSLKDKIESLRKDYYSLPADADLSEADSELEQLESRLDKIEVRFHHLLSELESTKNKILISETMPHVTEIESKQVNIKLPEIPLPHFSGLYEEWSTFKDQFNNLITKNEKLSNSQKLYYLRSALKGHAKQIECSDDTFEALFEALTLRYENKRAIFDMHIQAIMNHEKIQHESARELRFFVDNVKKNLRSLKSLEFTRNDFSDAILVNILLSKLDKETRKLFEATLNSTDIPKLDHFLEFVEKRSMVLESINRNSISGLKPHKNSPIPIMKSKSLVINSSEHVKCILCNTNHFLSKCKSFQDMNVAQRYEFVRKHKLCLNCLRNSHYSFACKSKFTCTQCGNKHHSLLHKSQEQMFSPNTLASALQTGNEPVNTLREETLEPQQNVYLSQAPIPSLTNTVKKKSTVLLSTAVLYIQNVCGERNECRAILDSASQINLITSEFANMLNLKKEKVYAPVSGINESVQTVKSRIYGTISNKNESFKEELEFLVIPKITDLTPSVPLNISNIHLPQCIQLADPEFFKPGKVHMLLGAEVFFRILQYEKLQISDSIMLQGSVFGFLVTGKLTISQPIKSCFLSRNEENLEESISRFWEMETVEEVKELKNEDELFCENHFKNTYSRNDTGRYVVNIPFKEDPQKLGKSKETAWRRLNALWNRLHKNPQLCSLYQGFMKEYEQLGHMERVEEEIEPDVTYYIPHHGVYRPDKSSTKLRVVFNASCPSSNGRSLNSLQANGGIIQDDLFSIITRFRKHPIAITADIEKMYRMILIAPTQRDCLRILWKSEKDEPVAVYKLNTVTYGTTSAPFLATRTLKQIAIDNRDNFPIAAELLETDFYVDDLVSGVSDIEAGKQVQKQLIELLSCAGMKLHKWSSNDKRILQELPFEAQEYHFDRDEEKVKTLGLIWNPKCDTFEFSVNDTSNTPEWTKRSVLSHIARIFDPMGLLGPIIITAKLFMKNLWLIKRDWDQPLSENEVRNWKKFILSLKALQGIKVNRYVLTEDYNSVELHGFSDASKEAFGAAIYLRCTTSSGQSTMKLLCSKSRVAPLKPVSIPRLELCAAELLAKLVKKVTASLRIEFHGVHLWTDSTIVLGWLQTDPWLLKTFVGNRVSRIREVTDSYCWRHIKSEQNPSDLVSRGLSAEKLVNCELWWKGPENFCDSLPSSKITLDSTNGEFAKELKKDCERTLKLTIDSKILDNWLNLTNKYLKLIRMFSFILRFSWNAKNPSSRRTGPLTSEEIKGAEQCLVRMVQVSEFSGDFKRLKRNEPVSSNSKLKSLNPFIDDKGIIRVGGRLGNSELDYGAKHPIVLPAKSKFTYLFMLHMHNKFYHLGPQSLLHSVRHQFWPINGRSLARKIVRECIICFKAKPRAVNQIMGTLPSERTTCSPPFNHVGVDFCGPLLIKDKSQRKNKLYKVYVAVFVCFVTKAMHIELVSDLTSEAFIACLKRLFARRGKSAFVYSDNAGNFVGANAELKRLFQLVTNSNEQLSSYLSSEGISWKFIPPRSPNFGGLWEACVKSVKHHLRRVVENARLTYEELLTVLVQIEAVLNSRPISPLSSDPNDFQALTPGHFLIGRPLTAVPEPDLLDIKVNRLSRWQFTTKIVHDIWQRWKKDYLGNLQQRTKWLWEKRNVAINDMVLLVDDNLPPCKWSLGRITEIVCGSDGLVRVVKIKTAKGILKRSVSKICILPIEKIDCV